MIRVAVLDDQKEYIDIVSEITKQCMLQMGISYELNGYLTYRQLMDDLEDDLNFDLYLLDMEMPEKTGLEVAKLIREKDFESVIIYITNHVEYAVEAYEVNAYRYIPKRLLNQKLPEAYKAICPLIDGKQEESFIIEKNHQIERIPYREIYYLKKENKNTLIVHKRGMSKVRLPISEVWQSMSDSQHFIMVDRSYVVNGCHVMTVKNQQVILRDGSIIPVSGPRLKQVKAEILQMWR